jgi:hypothetical protein
MIVEVEDKNEARAILPPAFRAEARIVGLNRFKMAHIEETIRRHTRAAEPEGASGG